VSFVLGSDKESWGVHDFWGTWATKRSSGAQWTEEDRIRQLGEMVMRLNTLMQDAKVHSLDALVGKPIEVTFKDFNTLHEWRILTEAI
jgi:CRISPR/Cas system CMR-associated protein Cmr1 (group 7 of RAMP superfamily)